MGRFALRVAFVVLGITSTQVGARAIQWPVRHDHNFMTADVSGSHEQGMVHGIALHTDDTTEQEIANVNSKLAIASGKVAAGNMNLMLGIVCAICIVSQIVGLIIGRQILAVSQGGPQMVKVAEAIRDGSESYVKTMFGTIFMLSLPATVLIFGLYLLQDHYTKALMITLSFVLGAVCSSVAGVTGMWSSTRANARVAETARTGSFQDTIVIALRAGVVAGLVVVSLAVLGISVLFFICRTFVEADLAKVPVLLVGYGFGASFVALFAQLGGGIYTKAADVGADLCGKIDLGLDEDDPRNPAVVADLVGDNVGDCCARGADLFESLAAEIIGAMILGGALTRDHLGEDVLIRFMLFPLVVHVVDLMVSLAGVMSVCGGGEPHKEGETLPNPMDMLKRGYIVTVALAAVAFVGTSRLLLHADVAPNAWWHFALCGLYGMACGFVIVFITQYYTDFEFQPVKDIAKASVGGSGTNVIQGLAVGFESTMMPVLVVCSAILVSFYLGKTSGIPSEDGGFEAGLFGTAVATMGMLSNLTYVLAMDIFGPITDNAAGIVEMSPDDCPPTARAMMDRLDATGNTTKAFTKGFAVSSAGLACFLLFSAFLDIVHTYTGKNVVIDIVRPEVFVGGLLGSATVFLFAGFAIKAVSIVAQDVVEEVRRQFEGDKKELILSGKLLPDHGKCVEIVSTQAIKMMVKPGVLVVLTPIAVGCFFRFIGHLEDRPLLGAQCMTSFLVCSSMTAMLVAFFLNNGGGAWDNAKKYVEAGNYGGKGSEAHKAAVTGDTVGDPCKDTAGPSLHVLMKLIATVTMVVGPLVAVPRS